MNFPYYYRLKRPLYKYHGENTHADKLRGLLSYGPLIPTNKINPKCLFVFKDTDREHANHLYLSLVNGIAAFPGVKQLTGISLGKDTVEALRVPETNSITRAFSDALEERLAGQSGLPDFAFILYKKEFALDAQDPYDAAKAVLTKYGVPSQYVSWELLDSTQQFGYAVSNIALSILVKLGGVPWGIAPRRDSKTLVLGIGKAETHSQVSGIPGRLIGFAICMLSDGLYLDTSYFPPAEDQNEFLKQLALGLREVLDRMLALRRNVERVTIHISQLERRDTIDVVNRTLREYKMAQQTPIPFELVRLTEDSDFSVFDLSHPGYVSEEGTVVAIGENHALVVTEGRREQAVWRGRKPVTLELNRQYCSSPSLQIQETIEDAFYLSSVNWRGFNAITQPLSLQYAKLLAQQVSKMSTFDPDICTYIRKHPGLNGIPWFI